MRFRAPGLPSLARALGVAAALVALLALTPAPNARAQVAAHPFGDPQTVEIGRSGETVQVVWRVGMADDLTLLGIALGVLPEDRVMLDGAITYEDGDAVAVTESEELAGYLLERIAVTAGGTSCPGEAVAVGDLIADGATLQFDCAPTSASMSEDVEVEVTTLLDLHEAYRTLATGPDGQRAVYGSDTTTHLWQLSDGSAVLATAGDAGGASGAPTSSSADGAGSADGPDGAGLGRSAVLQIGAVLGVLTLILVGALGLRRHRTTSLPPLKENQS
ncbi:hypothetical protein FXB39_10485 [Nocardioides sp. BGMRC 2183]|nr:hypothetical protein FXB39_10485 [Nocardioides sp. BGMRC 2183]